MKRNDMILRKAWMSSFSNAVTSQDDIDRICEPIYETFGTDGDGGFNACQSATYTCMTSPSQCNEAMIWEAYSKALADGYSADFQTFKRRSKAAGFLTALGQIAQGLFGNQNQAPVDNTPVTPMRTNNTPLIIGGVLLVLSVGVGVYFLTKKNK